MERPRKRPRKVCPGCGESYSSRYFIEHKNENHNIDENTWLCEPRSDRRDGERTATAVNQHLYMYEDMDSEDSIDCVSNTDVSLDDLSRSFDSHSSEKEKDDLDKLEGNIHDVNLPLETQISEDELDDENEQWDEELEEVRNDTVQSNEFEKTQQHYPSSVLVKLICLFISVWQATCAISDNAIKWLLEFLTALLKILGIHCAFVASLAAVFPSSLQMLWNILDIDREKFTKFAVCPKCNSIYSFQEAVIKDISGREKSLTCTYVKFPNHPHKSRRRPCGETIMKEVLLKGNKKSFYPRKVYCYKSVIDSLRQCVSSSTFQENCEKWKKRNIPADIFSDVTDGKVWKDFQHFVQKFGHYGLMLNFDFFQPFKHAVRSVAVIYLTFMNLPRSQRFQRKNVLLVGVIPPINRGTSINPFLTPLVRELDELWNVGFKSKSFLDGTLHTFKAALLCVACDLPAARKVCGFLSHSAKYGCSKCLKLFGGDFCKRDYSGFDRENWTKRDDLSHRKACEKMKNCATQDQLSTLESESGMRYSVLNNLFLRHTILCHRSHAQSIPWDSKKDD